MTAQVTRPLAANERAYLYAKERVLDGTFAPGELISEGEIAGALEVSRTPVREAFLKLESEGFLRLYPKRGALVVPISVGDLEALLEVRELVETHAATSAARRSPGERTQLQARLASLLEEQRSALDAEDLPAFVGADREFHAAVVAATGNQILNDLYESLSDRELRIMHSQLTVDPGQARVNYADHRRIADAIAIGDADTARHLVVEHVRATATALRR
ncbi:MAG: ydfH1 [Acidimicrobiaceae bacterium]|nr:ydfH1 [Acidimicrobiaceae bacterium]